MRKLKKFLVISLFICLLFLTVNVVAYDSRGTVNYYDLPSLGSDKYLDLGVKGFQQTTDYSCGACALMSVLRYYNLITPEQVNAVTEMKLAKQLGTNAERGTTPEEIIKWFKDHNIDVKSGTSGTLPILEQALQEKHPVLVEWIDWGGHWAVLTGLYREEMKGAYKPQDTYYFADSAIQWFADDNPDGISSFPIGRFESMWFDAQLFKKGTVIKGIYIIPLPQEGMKLDF